MEFFLQDLEHPPSLATKDSYTHHNNAPGADDAHNPHALLLATTYTNQSLRGFVYDCAIWWARVAGVLGKLSLAEKMFAFAADIAASHWGSDPSQPHDNMDSTSATPFRIEAGSKKD